MANETYIIRGGVEGRERLRLLSRVLKPTTLAFFERVGVRPGMACLDVGSGGGDVAIELACIVGPTGRVIGADIDDTKLAIARAEAVSQQRNNLEFRNVGVFDLEPIPTFDIVYSRFLLTHLSDPAAAIQRMKKTLKPGGRLVIEDIDFRGHFCEPDCASFRRFVDLYSETVRRNGGDPNIGPRLPLMLLDAGFERVNMNVVQPAGMEGEVRRVASITLENISASVVAAGLAAQEELARTLADLNAFAANPRTVMSLPRIVQTWGEAI